MEVVARRISYVACLATVLGGCDGSFEGEPLEGAGAFLEPEVALTPLDYGVEEGTVLVKYQASFDDAIDGILAGQRARVLRKFGFVNARLVAVNSPGEAQAMLRLPGVVGVYPNFRVQAVPTGKPSGGGGTISTEVVPDSIKRIKADAAWAASHTGAGVGVAIVDTGLDFLHADLTVSTSCFTAHTTCQDVDGHGTHVGGITAAKDNEIDVVGVAPLATLYAVRVLGDTGSGTDANIIAGLEWIVANAATLNPPIKVVNMSLGRSGSVADNEVLHAAIKAVVNAGITVVVAAGNSASSEITGQVPAAYPEVMAIASTTSRKGASPGKGACRGRFIDADTASYFTTDGAGVAVSAPGAEAEDVSVGCGLSSVGVLSTQNGGGTTRMSGTSMASPAIAGLAALLLAQNPALSPAGVRAAVGSTASCRATAPKDSPTGGYTFDAVREGVANAAAALGVPGFPSASCP